MDRDLAACLGLSGLIAAALAAFVYLPWEPRLDRKPDCDRSHGVASLSTSFDADAGLGWSIGLDARCDRWLPSPPIPPIQSQQPPYSAP